MALPDLTGQNIENTYQRVLQTDGTVIYDGTGSIFLPVSASYAVTASYAEYAVSASHEIIKEVSSSYADYAKESGLSTSSISASYALTASYALNSPDTFPYTGSAIISGSLTVTGSTEIQHLTASGLNYPTTDGGEKQLITTDSSGNLSFDWSDRTNIDIKNTSGTTLEIGTPVYISGFQGASIFQISAASSSLPGTMPAVGILDQTLNDNDQGYATLLGAVRGIDTDTPGYSINQSLYVGEGTLTSNRPTGSALIQKIARVGSVANNGEITVLGAGRSNDIPNLQPGYAWVGDSTWNAIATPTSSFNEDPFPYTGSAVISGSLEVIGDITGSGKIDLNDGNNNVIIGKGTNASSIGNSVVIGHQANASYSNVVIGSQAGGNISGNPRSSVWIGYQAGYSSNKNENDTVAIGYRAARNNNGRYSIYIGANAGYNLTGDDNIILGRYTNGVSTTSKSIIIGNSATADYNSVAIGYDAGNSTGNSNIFLGYQAGLNEIGSNKLYIENSNSTTPLIYGEFDNDLFRINGKLYVSNSLDVTGSVSASTYYGDGSNLTGIETDPFPYTGSAIISGSLTVTGSISSTDTVTAVTGSFSHLKGNSPITVQDPVTFQHTQGLDVLGNATIHSINEVELQTISKDFNYTSSLVVTEITASVNGAIIDYRLTNLNSGSRVGTFMYAHDGTELSYNDLTIPGGGIGDQPILSASLANNLVTINIENAAGFNFTGYAKKFNRLANAIPVADPNVTYLLNQYFSENVVGAYSIRQLDQFYTGSAMRVRRASDNSELDIEYDVNGYLDTLAIEAHCGGSVGHVTIWYDQSSNNRHLTQSIAGNQPKIYDGSSIYEVNGQPCLRTIDASSNPVLGGITGVDYTGGISVYNVVDGAGYGQNSVFLNPLSNGWNFRHGHSGVSPGFRVNNKTAQILNPRNDIYQILESGFYDNSTGTIYTFLKQQYGGNFTPLQTGSATGVSLSTTTNSELQIITRGNYQELIIMNDYEISNREGIFTNINNYYNIYETGLLAEYGGAAAAYSVRLLHSVYTGPSLRVREDGTDTEANIGFDSNGDLDTTALLAHCGSNNGFVVTWYDQSGNGNDATQATAANQPQIVSSGAVIVENGKPAVLNQGGLQELLLTSTINSSTNISAVAKANVGGWGYLTGQVYDGALRQNGGWYSNTPSVGGDYYYNGSLYLDGILTTSLTSAQQQRLIFANAQSGGSALSLVNIGGTYANRHWNGPIQEIIYWGTDQSTNRTGIETNINSYFNIYP